MDGAERRIGHAAVSKPPDMAVDLRGGQRCKLKNQGTLSQAGRCFTAIACGAAANGEVDPAEGRRCIAIDSCVRKTLSIRDGAIGR